ncbi:hypothetical protein HA466_0054760 [Hirschfeldia incana]|nr:hypothetical protein HA466_0054760 [Hirschfeldia incana]
MNVPPASQRPPSKRRPGRTSRSAMKPQTQNPKTLKTKRPSAPPDPEVAVKSAAGEETLIMMELGGAEAELGPCDYYGACHEVGDRYNNNLMSTNGDNVCLSFDDDIMDLLLDEADPSNVFAWCGGDAELSHLGNSEVARGLSETWSQDNLDSLQSCQSVESFINYKHQVTDDFIDCVWQEGNSISPRDEKENSDSIVSWLLDGDDATIGKINCENFGEPLNNDDENALVAWLLS